MQTTLRTFYDVRLVMAYQAHFQVVAFGSKEAVTKPTYLLTCSRHKIIFV
jgi:hypothetical protein